MRTTGTLRRLGVFVLVAMIVAPTTLLARDDKKDDNKDANKSAESTEAPKGPLSEEENPLLIGKRDINKHQIDFYSLQKEVALGQQMAAQVDRQGKFVDDPVITEYINRVGQNLVLHSDAKVPFTIKVLDSEDVNAFALPGGFFYVNKGLILAADNEAEIACVMAHEIGHVAARHGVEQASKAQVANFAMIPLIILTGGLGYLVYEAANIALPMAFLKFSRAMESEADMLGAEYAWAAGYDPAYLVKFFEKVQKLDKSKPGTLARAFDTHPPTADRITKVNNLISRFPDHEEYIVNTSDFNKIRSRMLALSNAKIVGAGGPGDASHRPTLKRRGGDSSDPGQQPESQPGPDRPTLKHPDGSTTGSDSTNTSPSAGSNAPSTSNPPAGSNPPSSSNPPANSNPSGSNPPSSSNPPANSNPGSTTQPANPYAPPPPPPPPPPGF
jgi:beta-barrel assembly-enhancing protease